MAARPLRIVPYKFLSTSSFSNTSNAPACRIAYTLVGMVQATVVVMDINMSKIGRHLKRRPD